MMELRLRLILLLLSFLGLGIVINLVKKYRLELKYALLWIGIGVLFVFLALDPIIANMIAYVLGIKTPSNAIYLLGIISLLMITFSLTISLSRMSNRIKYLTQELGLMRKKVEDIQAEEEHKKQEAQEAQEIQEVQE